MNIEKKYNKDAQNEDGLEIDIFKSIENDIVAYTEMLDKHTKDLANYNEQLEVDKELWEILSKPGSIRVVNPTRVFEQNERYWELAEKKQAFKLREDKAMAESTIKGLNHAIEQTALALDTAKEKSLKFKKDNMELVARLKRN
jgi:hypothetical protein